MRRRSFLVAAAALSASRKGGAQTSLGTLAWVEGGSLWIRELPDGRPSRVADAGGLHAPRFSSSGRWIAYQNGDDRLFVVRRDGQAGAPLESEAGVWLPGEDRLATVRDDRVVLIAPDKAAKPPAVLPKTTAPGVFAPDGQQFVYGRDVGDAGQLCLASLAAPEREPQVLVSNEGGGVQPYCWTRDGKSIVYWRAGEWSASLWNDGVGLSAVPVSGGDPRELGVATLVHDDSLDLAPKSAGNQLAVTRARGRQTWSEQRIAILNLETGARRDLTAENIAAISPAWSPDGRRIACVQAPDADVAYKKAMAGVNIRILRTDGTVETKVVTPEMNIGPGGGEEAHVFLQQRKIWLLDPAGADAPRQLTGDARYRDEEPVWSADGSHILFGRLDYDGHMSLWLMESSGARPTQVCRLQIPDPLVHGGNWFGFYGYTDWRDAFDWRR